MSKTGFILWDVPTRLFHWAVVICVALSWWSAEQQRYDLHLWSGCTVIVLVVFRVIWGFVGSRHSRFADFLAGPRRLDAYLRSGKHNSAGHNPLGGWSVLVLLGILLIQAISGLFNSDDILFSGPLHFGAAGDFRDFMGVVHDMAFNILLALVAVHVVAVLYHQLRLKEKLLQAMVWGRAPGREGRVAPAPWWPALLLVVLLGAALWWGLEQAPQPKPMQW